MFIVAQIIGFFGSLAMIISMWQKTRIKMLLYLCFDNIFYAIHYILLGAYAGAVNNVVGLVRTYTFAQKNKNSFLSKKYVLFIIIGLYAIFGVITYDGVSSLFPAIASIIYCAVIWLDKPKHIRIGTAVMLSLWILYNIGVKSYIGIITESCLFLSTIIAIIRIDVLRRGEKTGGKEEKR